MCEITLLWVLGTQLAGCCVFSELGKGTGLRLKGRRPAVPLFPAACSCALELTE